MGDYSTLKREGLRMAKEYWGEAHSLQMRKKTGMTGVAAG